MINDKNSIKMSTKGWKQGSQPVGQRILHTFLSCNGSLWLQEFWIRIICDINGYKKFYSFWSNFIFVFVYKLYNSNESIRVTLSYKYFNLFLSLLFYVRWTNHAIEQHDQSIHSYRVTGPCLCAMLWVRQCRTRVARRLYGWAGYSHFNWAGNTRSFAPQSLFSTAFTFWL